MAKERIGLAGSEQMGLAMVKHPVRNGYQVTVTDLNPDVDQAAVRVPDWIRLGTDLS